MNENQDFYYDLWERLEDSFPEIDSDICRDLYITNKEYKELCCKANTLLQKNPFIEEILEKEEALRLSAKDHKKLLQYLLLKKKIEDIERQKIYFRGHTDGFKYLKNIEIL